MLSAAYSDHLAELKSTLDRTPPSEKQGMHAASGKQTLDLTPYDFHAVVREHGHDAVKYDFSTGLREVVQSADDFGWTTVDINSGQVIEQQEGAFRVNCLDWSVYYECLRVRPTLMVQFGSDKLRTRSHLVHRPIPLSLLSRLHARLQSHILDRAPHIMGRQW